MADEETMHQDTGGTGRKLASGDHFTRAEVRLALRNHGTPLEALRYPVTPIGLHYLLSHFDIPAVDPSSWRLSVTGMVERPQSLTLDDLMRLPAAQHAVTLECAGNGRALLDPHTVSQPWLEEAVGTSVWTGARLRDVLVTAGVEPDVVELVFTGLDRGAQGGVVQQFQRSLRTDQALHESVLLAYAMNGQPLPPQHGAPLRLVVPGWYGVASVKWLASIEAVGEPFRGYQMTRSYRYTQHADDPGEPVTLMRVRALMVPPGIPDFLTRVRLLPPGPVTVYGRAWSGDGPVARVEFSADGGDSWVEAALDDPEEDHAWQGWSTVWDASPGRHVLAVRAMDAAGRTQPWEGHWNLQGMGNNGVQRVGVVVA